MAEYEDEEEAPPHPADPPQALTDFVGVFTDPQASEVFRDAAVRVQDYVVQRDIAADNQAAADRLVGNLGTFKDGLVGMASADPAATFLGLDLVPGVVGGIVETHPFLPDDQRAGTYDQLANDMQRDIARAGVMALADRDDAAARRMLGHDRIAGLFDDRDRMALDGYIGAQATARTIDAAAVAQQRAVDMARDTTFSAVKYLGALVDPRTQEIAFPDGWAARVTADPSLPPGDTASMLNVYTRLQRDGDAPQSDPYLVADMIQRIAGGNPPDAREILSQAGQGLRLTDAVGLARSTVGTLPPAARKEFSDLAAAVDTARTHLASPENGPAGQVAFGRFMGWFLNSYPPGSLDPNAQQPYDLGAAVARFAPTSDDMVRAVSPPPAERVPLDQIFGPRKRANV